MFKYNEKSVESKEFLVRWLNAKIVELQKNKVFITRCTFKFGLRFV